MSSPLNEDERAKVFLKFIKEGGSWTENLKRFEEGPDVPGSVWSSLAQRLYNDRHKNFRKRLYQAWKGKKGKSALREKVLLLLHHNESESDKTGTSVGATETQTSSERNKSFERFCHGQGKVAKHMQDSECSNADGDFILERAENIDVTDCASSHVQPDVLQVPEGKFLKHDAEDEALFTEDEEIKDSTSGNAHVSPKRQRLIINLHDGGELTCPKEVEITDCETNIDEASHLRQCQLVNACKEGEAVCPQERNIIDCSYEKDVSAIQDSKLAEDNVDVSQPFNVNPKQLDTEGNEDENTEMNSDSEMSCSQKSSESDVAAVTEGRIILSPDEFSQVYNNKRRRGLATGWTDVFYDKFHEIWPHCALSAIDNRCRTENSRKGNCAPFWKGIFSCRVRDDCIKVIMTIAEVPDKNVDVPVDVTIVGTCSHSLRNGNEHEAMKQGRPNRRFLKGKRRMLTAELVTDCCKSPSEIHYAALGQLTADECLAANTTGCQTPQVIRQAAHERRVAEQLHRDMLQELDVQREAWSVSMPGKVLSGYIQTISVVPFSITFFMEAQIAQYVKYCKSDASSTVHFDATGSVIREINDQKRPLYYCMVLAEASLPVFEFITTTHASVSIRSQLDFFNDKVRLYNAGRSINPHYAVTDFSYALIDATLRSFNGMTMASYLQYCHRALTYKLSLTELTSVTHVCLCVAHFTKLMYNRLCKVELNLTKRQTFILFFVALQRSAVLERAKEVYRMIHTVMCSGNKTSAFMEASNQLRRMCLGLKVYEDCNEMRNLNVCNESESSVIAEDESDIDSRHSGNSATPGTLVAQSPFFAEFKGATSGESIPADNEVDVNDLCNLNAFKVLESVIHLFPLWSAALHEKVERLAREVPEKERSKPWVLNCKSNAAIESHFKGVKQGRLNNQLRVRPRQFVAKELQYVLGKLNEANISKAEVRRTLPKKKEVQHAVERWRKRRKATLYADSRKAAEILKKCFNAGRSGRIMCGKVKGDIANETQCDLNESRASVPAASEQKVSLQRKTETETTVMEIKEKETEVEGLNVGTKIRNEKKEKAAKKIERSKYTAPTVTSRSWKTCRLDDRDIERALSILRKKHPDIDGLQYPGNGACIRDKSMPRFSPVTKPFVQILHLPDHWICVSNVLCTNKQEIWLFDSLLPRRVSSSVVVQLTSLLRLNENPDTITVHIRNCSRQPFATATCGFYAIAAAVTLCEGRDPTTLKFDPFELVKSVLKGLNSGKFKISSYKCETVKPMSLKISVLSKLHCICHKPSNKKMVMCDICRNWFHVSCMSVTERDRLATSDIWMGPCCKHDETVQCATDITESTSQHDESVAASKFSCNPVGSSALNPENYWKERKTDELGHEKYRQRASKAQTKDISTSKKNVQETHHSKKLIKTADDITEKESESGCTLNGTVGQVNEDDNELVLQEFMDSLRHARVAAAWLHKNRKLLRGHVTEPIIMKQRDNDIVCKIRREISAGFVYTDFRDYLLFDFTNVEDVKLFLSRVREQMECAAHVCLNGSQYIENNTEH